MSVLTNRYRPRKLADVIGQARACDVLSRSLDGLRHHAFLLSGPSGVGKTTLARIGAAVLQADPVEIDGATHTGIDDMRRMQDTLQYKPLGMERIALIVDEAHRLSPQTWDSMLKIVEEPPDHVFWFLCTTAPNKVPSTIRNRCAELKLHPVSSAAIEQLLLKVVDAEKVTIGHDVLTMIAREAGGSPRKALIDLPQCYGLGINEARALLRSQVESKPVAELCKLMLDGGTWLQCMGVLASMPVEDAEAHRIAITNYIAAILRNAKTNKDAAYLLDVLDQFSEPYHPGERQAPLMLSIGRVIFNSP